jgi:hypothetical protein
MPVQVACGLDWRTNTVLYLDSLGGGQECSNAGRVTGLLLEWAARARSGNPLGQVLLLSSQVVVLHDYLSCDRVKQGSRCLRDILH